MGGSRAERSTRLDVDGGGGLLGFRSALSLGNELGRDDSRRRHPALPLAAFRQRLAVRHRGSVVLPEQKKMRWETITDS